MILYYAGGFWTKKIILLDNQIKAINHELTVTTAAANEVDRIKKELDALQRKTEVIQNLEKTRREPAQLLEAMTGLVIEKRMWFTNFTDIQKTIKIKGIALDNKTVADFMTELEKSGIFSSVNLNSLKQVTLQKTLNLKNFEITCLKAKTDKASEKKAAKS